MDNKYLFVSYANADQEQVIPFAQLVQNYLERRMSPVQVWVDISDLKPGEAWDSAITDALENSIGFLFFVSPYSMESEWIKSELQFALRNPDRLIIPVFLNGYMTDVPDELMMRNGIVLNDQDSDAEKLKAAKSIVQAVDLYLKDNPLAESAVSKEEAPRIAQELVKELRFQSEITEEAEQPSSVFVVHGHSNDALNVLEGFLESVQVTPVILSRLTDGQQSLFQKFMRVASKAKFAIAIISSDDFGASRKQYEADGVGEKALQFRARQNVILELGFFYGKLGWENVFVLYEDPNKVFPNFERPSDLGGVVFDSMSDINWKENLKQKLEQAGFQIPVSN